MEKRKHLSDPRGLIYESYRIAGVTAGECRSIFLDWALGIPENEDFKEHVVAMLTTHSHGATKHPMTGILRAALTSSPKPQRRGGKRGADKASA